MVWTLCKVAISAGVITAVTVVAKASPRMGAVLLTLPIVSLIAFALAWTEQRNLKAISQMARETLVLVPLGLPFFVPLAFAERLRLGFWAAFSLGIALAVCGIGIWLRFGPKTL
jgi:hypothetical protein